MQYRALADISVSRLALGTLTWGNTIPKKEAGKLLGTFLEKGGNLIDTAASYGGGMVEELLGELLPSFPRDSYLVASKAGLRIQNGQQKYLTDRKSMLSDLKQSLTRMKLDYLDIWQIHAWGEAPLAETLAAMDDAIRHGYVRHIGLSNFVGWQTAQAVTWQRSLGAPENPSEVVKDLAHYPICSTQFEYSLVARQAELEIIPAAQEYQLGCLAWSPLGRGILNGKYLDGIPTGSRADSKELDWFIQPYLQPQYRGIIRGLLTGAKGLGLTPAEIAWLWVRDATGITAAITGARDLTQLNQLLALEDAELPTQIRAALDDISLGL